MKFNIAGARSTDFTDEDFRHLGHAYGMFLRNHDLKKCVIGYDTRLKSRIFATVCAEILASMGIEVLLFGEPCPTPLLSYVIKEEDCAGGMMITSSHNSKQWHGVKCYGSTGAQLLEDDSKEIERYLELDINYYYAPACASLIQYVPYQKWEDYYREILRQRVNNINCNINVVYSPLSGVGLRAVEKIAQYIGVKNLYIPESQKYPNPEFPESNPPNPEKFEIYAPARALCSQLSDIDAILINDSDADRLGIMIPTEEGFYKFTGNEVGVLFLYYILTNITEQDRLEFKFVMSKVSSKLALNIAKEYIPTHSNIVTTPVGFRYLVNAFVAPFLTRNFFAFEESCGYLKGNYVQEKDGILAFMLACEMIAFYKRRGKTLKDIFKEIYQLFGYYKTKTLLISNCDEEVENRHEEGLQIIYRQSGTEKALKIYITVWSEDEETSQELLLQKIVEIKNSFCNYDIIELD